jgi:hypothetical protein
MGKAIPLLLELRDVALDPSEDGSMGEIDATFSHHIGKVAIAELVGDVPADAENNY